MLKTHFKLESRQHNLVVQELNGEILIYDLRENKAFCLNATSALVWQACDGNKTIDEISAEISRQLNSPVSEDFVWLALEQLRKENLIENSTEVYAPFEGLSRREIIRKVGLASLIALPMVSSLVAPTAIQATSPNCTGTTGRPNGCACTAAGQCANQCCGTSGTVTTCVAPGLDPTGAACRAACECDSNCCGIGFTCANARTKTTGTACRVNCECVSNNCGTGNVCT